MSRPILVVTANDNETNAFRNQENFKLFPKEKQDKINKGNDINDTNTYYCGTYCDYNIATFQLPEQGSVKSDASLYSIDAAIKRFKPCAVVLLGIAFGADKNSQRIGDVLVSERVIDYESIKVTKKGTERRGAIPDAGRFLLSACRELKANWKHKAGRNYARVYIGNIASGDKLIDCKCFKDTLPVGDSTIIGGEMEGRGLYSACRRNDLSEWIIIKAICDWGYNKQNRRKEQWQQLAASSAACFFDALLYRNLLRLPADDSDSNNKSDNQLPKGRKSLAQRKQANPKVPKESSRFKLVDTNKNPDSKDNKVKTGTGKKANTKHRDEKDVNDNTVGYIVHFGTTTCRIFAMLKDKQNLKEFKVISYNNTDSSTNKDEYFNDLIKQVKNEIKPEVDKENNLFVKVFADASFDDLFSNEESKNDFVNVFYRETGLYFNIISQKQTEDNLKKLFQNDADAVIDIGRQDVTILVRTREKKSSKGKFKTIALKISLNDVSDYIKKHSIGEIWTKEDISSIKKHIKELISPSLKNIEANKAIIIKNELEFMMSNGYHLRQINGYNCIEFNEYKKDNRNSLFNVDYLSLVEKNASSQGEIKRKYGFKLGHIILETIFELMKTQTIIPSNEISMHGDQFAYIFNVAVSGSTKDERASFMVDAITLLKKKGLTVLSPKLSNGQLREQTLETQYDHIQALRDCDLLFVCNKDGYIGDQTKREVFAAYVLNKPIAFWTEPPQEKTNTFSNDDFNYIPHEAWERLIKYLEEDK